MAHALDLTGWTPAVLRVEDATLEWVYTGELRFDDPFFEQTIERALQDPFALLFRRRTPLSVAADWVRRSPGLAPSGFVFHLSRCGSTLVSQMLAQSPRFLVLSEAGPIDAALRATAPESQRVEWLRTLVSALAQPRHGETHLFVKLDSWSVLHLALVERAFPGVPWIFLFRQPDEVLASQLRRSGVHCVPGVLPAELFGLTLETAVRLPREEYIGRVLARMCQAALDHASSPNGLFVDYTELPTFVLDRLPGHFGFTPTERERAQMLAAAGRDAKNPSIPFEPGTDAVPAAAQEVATRLLDPLYERLRAC